MESKFCFIFEYKEAYTGGSLVIACKKSELMSLLRNYFSDKMPNLEFFLFPSKNVSKFMLMREYYKSCNSGVGVKLSKLKGVLFQDLDINYLYCVEIMRAVNKFLEEDGENPTEDPMVRLDWIQDLDCIEGLYLIETFEIDASIKSRVVSDTYYNS